MRRPWDSIEFSEEIAYEPDEPESPAIPAILGGL